MANVLCIVTSPRKNGYTYQAFKAVTDEIEKTGARVEEIFLARRKINPCVSCFHCVRDDNHLCCQDDDMGKNGELMDKIKKADALFIADPVYCWSNTARSQTFMERMYPLLWTTQINGIPFGVVCCASNQGMMHEASRQFCKLAFTYKMAWINGLDIHLADFENKLKQCKKLGKELGEAAIDARTNGRKKMTEAELVKSYVGERWNPIYGYLKNLTGGTFAWNQSLPYLALANENFQKEEAKAELEKTVNYLKEMLQAWKLKDMTACIELFPKVSSSWTSATWMEFLEDSVIGTKKPKAYRAEK